MIQIYTCMDDFNKSKRFILSNDEEFEDKISKESILESDRQLMQQIDSVTKADATAVITPYGITDIYNLSTGCKTAINISHIKEQVGYREYPIVNITECGQNVIKIIFDMIDNTEIEVYLAHCFLDTILDCKYTFNVIGKGRAESVVDLIGMIE